MNNTIFDDVFRTMIEKMPYLAVPLINEVFHTSYPEDVKITHLRNEHQQEDGEIITDSCPVSYTHLDVYKRQGI